MNTLVPSASIVLKRILAGTAAPARGEYEDTAVLWVYRNYDGHWRVRQEGSEIEATFDRREDALGFARAAGQAWDSYRLFIQLKDGRVTEELFNLGRHSAVLATWRPDMMMFTHLASSVRTPPKTGRGPADKLTYRRERRREMRALLVAAVVALLVVVTVIAGRFAAYVASHGDQPLYRDLGRVIR